MIGTRTVDGFEVLTLAGEAEGGVEVGFAPRAGMVGCSLRHRGEELLGQRHGLAVYAERGKTMGIPLLYPWANRLGGDGFEVAGRAVDLSGEGLRMSRDEAGLAIHGLLAGAASWEVEAHEERGDGGLLRAGFDFGAHEELLAAFPFPHRLLLEATLDGAVLTVRADVVASDGSPVPVAFGFHPYLTLPGVDCAGWEIEAPVDTRLALDDRMLPNGERVPAAIEPGPLGDRTFDDAFTAPPGGAPFALSGAGRRVEVRLGPDYPFSQVYAPADDDVVAFEPMTAPTNALLSGEGLRVLRPGEKFSAEFSISVRAT